MNKLMKLIAPVILSIYFCAGVVGPAWGEEGKGLTAAQLQINLEKYNSEKKDPMFAVSLSALIPSLGHLYAGDWGRSSKFVIYEVVGIGLLMTSANQAAESPQFTPINGTFIVGMTMLGIAHLMEMIDVYYMVDEFNGRLKRQYDISYKIYERHFEMFCSVTI